jgi:uridine kinase
MRGAAMTASFTQIVKRDGTLEPFNAEKITVAIYKAAAAIGGHDRELSERLSRQVVESLAVIYTAEEPPTVEDVQDMVERSLIKNVYADTAKAYILYRHERARMRKLREEEKLELVPYKAMWHALDWAVAHECETVDKLNSILRGGRLPWLVQEAEARYESILDEAARAILERRGELRFVIVAGPSSSGKTTTTLKLTERLERGGVHVIPMALDNYFFDLEHHPRDDSGDYDFETPEAMDLPLINRQLVELDRGRGGGRSTCPRMTSRSGRALPGPRASPPHRTASFCSTLCMASTKGSPRASRKSGSSAFTSRPSASSRLMKDAMSAGLTSASCGE